MSKVDSTQPQLEGLEFEAREYLIRYYTCARPECRYRTELLEKAREHEHELTHRGHCYKEYVIKSRIRLPRD
ncbi:MAG: hypothetical protein QXL93_01750 [Candidatus Nitrosocaldus sp.]